MAGGDLTDDQLYGGDPTTFASAYTPYAAEIKVMLMGPKATDSGLAYVGSLPRTVFLNKVSTNELIAISKPINAHQPIRIKSVI
jgi:hypothetical protein